MRRDDTREDTARSERKAEYFLRENWTGEISLNPLDKLAFWRRRFRAYCEALDEVMQEFHESGTVMEPAAVAAALAKLDQLVGRAEDDNLGGRSAGLSGILRESIRPLVNELGKRLSSLPVQLLERPEYADFWALKWSDVLRSNRKTIQVKGTHVYQKWLHSHIERDTGFDTVVRELLTANGSSYANPPANYYRIARDPQNLAETTAQLFFGVRMQCAKCHNHPFERWTQDDYYSMSAFFARVKQKKDLEEPGPNPQTPGAEVIYSDRAGEVTQPRTGKVMPPKIRTSAAEVSDIGLSLRCLNH